MKGCSSFLTSIIVRYVGLVFVLNTEYLFDYGERPRFRWEAQWYTIEHNYHGPNLK